MRKVDRPWPFILFLSAGAAGVVAYALPGTLFSFVVIIWFLLVCPGMMVVRYLDLKDPTAEWTLAIALSLAIDGIVASIALYVGVWSPPGILGALMAMCILGAGADILLSRFDQHTLARWLARNRNRSGWLALPLFVVILTTDAGAAQTPVAPHTAPLPTTTPATTTSPPGPLPTGPVLDTVIVVDNIDHITTYDPQGDRYQAAQLFVTLAPVGSEVGIVRITSSPNAIRVLALQQLSTSSDRALVTNSLTEAAFGPVDPTPVAYFSPALEMAGTMLLARPSTDRKLILIFTDALAFSGDQTPCTSSPGTDYTWLCTFLALEQQGITVALIGFTLPGNTATLQPVQQFFATYGGVVTPVSDGPNLADQLAATYRVLLSGPRFPPLSRRENW